VVDAVVVGVAAGLGVLPAVSVVGTVDAGAEHLVAIIATACCGGNLSADGPAETATLSGAVGFALVRILPRAGLTIGLLVRTAEGVALALGKALAEMVNAIGLEVAARVLVASAIPVVRAVRTSAIILLIVVATAGIRSGLPSSGPILTAAGAVLGQEVRVLRLGLTIACDASE